MSEGSSGVVSPHISLKVTQGGREGVEIIASRFSRGKWEKQRSGFPWCDRGTPAAGRHVLAELTRFSATRMRAEMCFSSKAFKSEFPDGKLKIFKPSCKNFKARGRKY